MSNDNEKKIDQDEEGKQDSGSGDLGEIGGEIRFRYKDAMSIAPRDDVLPSSEIKRLLAVHKELHKERVDKQKVTRKERKTLKEGRTHFAAGDGLRSGYGSGQHSTYKQHPITNKAQFSGMDRQVISLPNENRAETNEEKRNDLENRLEHRLENRNELRRQNTPGFNPKPRPF